MKKILIIGATSAIAEATARIWAERGAELFLIARNSERLNIISKDLIIRGASQVNTYCLDVNQLNAHPVMFEKIFLALKKVDIALIAYGTLPNQKECEQSIDLTMHEIKTNALSVIALMSYLANILERQKSGVIAVITSVAGDRGRAINYVYGASKAMVTTFSSGLRQRLYKSNVTVVTIKPGFVDTPMTVKFKKGFLWISPQVAAVKIIDAIDRKKSEVYVPTFWRFIMTFIKTMPSHIFNKLNF